MSQKYELIHSASSTSSLFIYRRVFVPFCSSKRIPCSSTAGRFEPQLNGFYGGIADKHPKGKSQLNGLEEGIEPDLNYFFLTEVNIYQYATPLPFREGAGVRSKGAFELDSKPFEHCRKPAFFIPFHYRYP